MARTTRRTDKRHPSTRPDRSARWTAQREHLLQSAQRAIHREGPQISMDDIAAEAGITKPILYRHFGDRRGLARALRDSVFGFALGGASDDPATARRAARERVAALYPIVEDPDELRRVVVGFATGFQMFVEFNRNLYRFLRSEGVLDQMWEGTDDSNTEPVAASLSGSLQAIFRGRGIDAVTAELWAHALRGMVGGVVDWWTEAHACDRFEVERQFDLLARAMIGGLEQSLPRSSRASNASTASNPSSRRARTSAPERKKRPRSTRRRS